MAPAGHLTMTRSAPSAAARYELGVVLKGQHPSGMPLCNEPHPCCPQKRTVICDPILCQPLNCTHQVHPEELCCPICEGTWGMG